MLKMLITRVSSCFILCSFAGCAISYDIMQEQALDTCKKIVDWNERSSCLAKHKTSYDHYEKQRQELLNKK